MKRAEEHINSIDQHSEWKTKLKPDLHFVERQPDNSDSKIVRKLEVEIYCLVGVKNKTVV